MSMFLRMTKHVSRNIDCGPGVKSWATTDMASLPPSRGKTSIAAGRQAVLTKTKRSQRIPRMFCRTCIGMPGQLDPTQDLITFEPLR